MRASSFYITWILLFFRGNAQSVQNPVTTVWMLRKIRLVRALALSSAALFVIFCCSIDSSSQPYARNRKPCLPSLAGRPYSIKAPTAQDTQFLTSLWKSLKSLFDQHRPEPGHIDPASHSEIPDQKKLGTFFRLTDEESEHTRSKHQQLWTRLPPYPQKQFRGRGVVVLAGDRYSEFAATSLGMLRETGSKLPVEVWVNGQGDDEWCNELQLQGMACRKLSDYMSLGDLHHPYQWKVFTLLYSTFEEILFLDADSIPLKNPDFVFDSAIYKKNGVILWPDYWRHTGSPWLPYLIGINDTKSSDMIMSETSIESGQLYWNKKTHWKSLVLATYYNYFGYDFWYTVFNNGWAGWGDKDTFAMACKAAQQQYYQVPHEIVTIFAQGTSHGIGMVQADPTNTDEHLLLFMHANIHKLSMRELLCSEDCKEIPGQGGRTFHMIDEGSSIHKSLRQGNRIFTANQLFEHNIDPEPLIWRVLEHNACRTHWGSPHLCRNARDHMEKTFGYKFTPYSRVDEDVGMQNNLDVCVEGPWVNPSRAKPRPTVLTKDYQEVYMD